MALGEKWGGVFWGTARPIVTSFRRSAKYQNVDYMAGFPGPLSGLLRPGVILRLYFQFRALLPGASDGIRRF